MLLEERGTFSVKERWFATTHWSAVLAAKEAASAQASEDKGCIGVWSSAGQGD
jgi:hypothetical protein